MVAEAFLERPGTPCFTSTASFRQLESRSKSGAVGVQRLPLILRQDCGVHERGFLALLCFLCSVGNFRLVLCSFSVVPQMCTDFSDLDPFLKGP